MDTNYILILICFAQLGTIIGFMIRFHFRIKELETKAHSPKKTGKWIIYAERGEPYLREIGEHVHYWTDKQNLAKTFKTFDEAQKDKLEYWSSVDWIYPIEQTEEVKNN